MQQRLFEGYIEVTGQIPEIAGDSRCKCVKVTEIIHCSARQMTHQSGQGPGKILFGPFELDARAAELSKNNHKIRLQEQPFQILLMLLEQPGEVVLRDEIRKRLWPNDTIVEFDHSINAAIKRLRDALGESAEQPRYVETIARRGYRFIGEIQTENPQPVEAVAESQLSSDESGPSSNQINKRSRAAAVSAAVVSSRFPLRVGFALIMSILLAGSIALRWTADSSVIPGRLIARLSLTSTDSSPLTHLQMSVQPADKFISSHSARPSPTAFALSPDGRRIVFTATRGTDPPQIYSRELGQSEATPIPGTEGAQGLFFSPDGQWIGFFGEDAIKKVSTKGGPPVVIYDVPRGQGVFGASWGEDGIVFSHRSLGIFKIPPGGGKPVPITKADKGEWHLLPQTVPGGKAVIFTNVTGGEGARAQVVLQLLQTGKRRVLIEQGADARYIETGHLVYMKSGTLMAVAFDVKKLQTSGEPVALIENVMQSINTLNSADETLAGQFAISNSGTLAYATGGVHPNPEYSLYWVDRKGTEQPLLARPKTSYGWARVSPSGSALALHSRSPVQTTDIWIYDILRQIPVRLTFTGRNVSPIWSPDGKRLVYASNVSGRFNLYMMNADAADKIDRLTTSEYDQFPSSWTSHGNVIAFTEFHRPENRISVLQMDGGHTPTVIVESGSNLGWPEFSPDGQWIAYVSEETGTSEVYVISYPVRGEKHRISSEQGFEPIWMPNGRELLYRDRDRQRFFSVTIKSLYPFKPEAPRLLFEGKKYGRYAPTRGWDVTADGQRFVIARNEESKMNPVTQIEVVLNWTGELRRVSGK
jgi:Tol biopolymer transport system component/DNA-binding winged helix-turn-helix (wHTH) protein